MDQHFYSYIAHAEYEKAASLFCQTDRTQIKDALMMIAYETESIAVVGFALYLFGHTGDYFWYDCIISLLLNPLCHIEGAYSLAFRYAKTVLAHERNADNLLQVLFFNSIPEKLLSDADALRIAEEIIALCPDHPTAGIITDRLSRTKPDKPHAP